MSSELSIPVTSPEVVRKCLEQYREKKMFGGDAAQQKPRRFNLTADITQAGRIYEATLEEQSVPASIVAMIKNR